MSVAFCGRGDKPSWDVGVGHTIADVIAEFDSACATSRHIGHADILREQIDGATGD